MSDTIQMFKYLRIDPNEITCLMSYASLKEVEIRIDRAINKFPYKDSQQIAIEIDSELERDNQFYPLMDLAQIAKKQLKAKFGKK